MTSSEEPFSISPPHISTYLIFELSPLPTKTHQISRVPRSSNAPICKNPPPILLIPPPPPAIPQQMASRLGFTVTKPRFFTAHFRNPFFSVPLLPSSAPGVQFGAKKLSFRRRLLVLSPKATTDQPGQVQEDEVVDSNVLPYCSIDQKQKKSLGEMEQEFLQALQAFYYEGKAIMSNEEFDNLKEELMWEGSSVVMLSADEQRFLEASMAYVSGNPIMTDEEFDKLKQKLKMDGSEIVVEGPRCSLRSRKVYSDLSVDYLKMFLLNVPAAVVALGLFFFLDDLTGFEITYLLELPEPFSFLFTWFAALPFILWLSFTITNFIVKDFLILVGPCPNCGMENTSFFGTILSISSGGSANNVKCANCGTEMVYDSQTRLITLPEGSEA
ncbi:PGR5-like protein 1A, chloroplastic [Sesamum alatum]|uniref:PGR5-like protein 1A, chloroplastic n=1 Tax=Sesamum alatum TaxID=300844 RepID=A0AAE2CUR9_9LAMI|nr:PGR5-like protein 1A, chloroplastic [Sesamum alatum]